MEIKNVKRGFWKPEEDLILKKYVETHGEGHWATLSKKSGLMRSAKSCRLRWKNYLSPNIKRGSMSEDEKDLIIRMHKLLGNRWSLIAGRVPGRTDNEIKNYWNTHLNKKPRSRKNVQANSISTERTSPSSIRQGNVGSRCTTEDAGNKCSNFSELDMRNIASDTKFSLPGSDVAFLDNNGAFMAMLDDLDLFEAFDVDGLPVF